MKSYKDTLTEIMEYFAEKGMLFSNEQDFQFALAIELKLGERNENAEKADNVKLEVLTLDNKNGEAKHDNKEYTDIIIDDKCAIELKYKTTDKGKNGINYDIKGNVVNVGAQGGYNIGVVNFLEDIHRLERINERFYPNKNKPNIKEKYAIIMANDEKYWNGWTPQKNNKQKEAYDAISKAIAAKGDEKSCKIPKIDTTVTINKKDHKINIKGDYKGKWKYYDLKGCDSYDKCKVPKFKYLIVKVN